MRIAFLAAAALAFSLSAGAAPKWTPDYSKSELKFEGKFGQNTVVGTFGKFTADVAFDAADLAGSKIVVTVDVASVKTVVAPEAHYADETDAALPGKGWFNAAANPQAVFTSTAIASKGGNKYEAKGTLALRGVTKEIVLPFELAVTGNTAVAKGSLPVNRMDFGIRGDAPQYALPKPVPHEVKIDFKLTASK